MNKILVTLISIALVGLFLHPIDSDGDLFHHLNIGRIVLQTHTIPHYDTLTFTASGKEYVAYAWLSGVILYLIYKTFGELGISILALVTAFMTFYLLSVYLRVLKIPDKIALLVIAITAPVAATRWPTRPEIFSYPILIAFLLINELKNRRRSLVFLYPLLMLLYVNLYGSSFPVAAVILALILFMNLKEDKFKVLQTKIIFYSSIIVSFPLSLLNGYGFKSLLFFLTIPKMTSLWSDWAGLVTIIRGPGFYNFPITVIAAYLIYFAYCILVFAAVFKKSKENHFLALLALSLFVPFFAARQRTLAVLLSAPFLAVCITFISGKFKYLYSLGIFIALFLTIVIIANNPPGITDKNGYPAGAVQFIRENKLSGRVLNAPRIGSYLSYYLWPEVLVYSDTRDDLFIGTGTLERLNLFLINSANPQYLILKYKINMVIASPSDGPAFRDFFYDKTRAPVFYDGNYFVIIPREAAVKKNILILDRINPYSRTEKK